MSIETELGGLASQISRAAQASGRSAAQIRLVAVSKKQPLDAMQEYVTAAEVLSLPVIFGENYVQELKSKRAHFPNHVEFHLLGPLQSNKLRDAVRHADVIQSVHSLSILKGIAGEASKQGKQQRVFIQVNIGEDPAKSGFSSADVVDVVRQAQELLPSICLVGLMTITPLHEEPEMARADFRAMSRLREELIRQGMAGLFEGGRPLLSMGMSADFEIAIEEGADLVRIGTAIFGSRV